MSREPVNDFATARTHIERLFQYELSNPDLLREALHAGDPITIGIKQISEGNKRVAQVGDAVIDALLLHNAYLAGYSKGEADNYRKRMGCNENLSRLGTANNIGDYLKLSDGTTQISPYMMATAVEAIFGAFFVDSRLDMNLMQRALMAFQGEV